MVQDDQEKAKSNGRQSAGEDQIPTGKMAQRRQRKVSAQAGNDDIITPHYYRSPQHWAFRKVRTYSLSVKTAGILSFQETITININDSQAIIAIMPWQKTL